MSDTTDITGSETASAADETAGVAEAAVAAATEAAAEAAAEGEEGKKPETPSEPKWFKPAIDRLTREKHEARRETEQLRAELELERAARRKAGDDGDTETKPAAVPTEAEIERRAQEIVAQRRAEERTQSLIADGVKEFGAEDWNKKTGIIATLGATENPAFMRALTAIPAGHKVAVALADDPDRLTSLLRMDPLEMAAEMGRLSVEAGTPKPKTISSAPKPITPVTGRGTPTPDITDTSMPMKEWVALRNKTAPVRLGGQRRPA